MTTRMVHPEHGATHAYDKGEVERLGKLGWMVETLDSESGDRTRTCVSSVGEVLSISPRQTEELSVEQGAKRKPGRPPKAK